MGVIIFGPIYLMIFVIEIAACIPVFLFGGVSLGTKKKSYKRRRSNY